MSRLLKSLLILTIVVAFSACGGSNKFKVEQRSSDIPTVPVRVAVPAFSDNRGFDEFVNRGITMVPLIGIRGGYYYDRHDDIYKGATEPFPELAARTLAERLNENEVFVEAEPLKTTGLPPAGAYDIVIDGRINRLRSAGHVYRYGLSIFGDIPWLIGLPSLDRHWELEFEYRLVNGYTGEPLTEYKKVSHETTSTFFTRYYHRGKTTDLVNDITPVLDEFIDWFWQTMPVEDRQYWASLRSEGEQYVARLRLEEETARRGTPPTFSFLAPAEGVAVREARVPVRWSISAPNGLKTVALVVNNQPVDLGIDALSLVNVDGAPRSVPATETSVPLRIGRNEMEALVADHRDNETRASFSLVRLPQELRPAQRYALLIATGSEADQQSAQAISEVFTDPLIGQFNSDNIRVTTASTLSREQLQDELSRFGSRPLAGNLAVVYLRTTGDWETLSLGGGAITLPEFITLLESSLATSEVALFLDIDWTGSGDDTLSNRLESLPARWAFFTAQSRGGASTKPLLAESLVDTMRGDPDNPRRLTLERLLDGLLVDIERKDASYRPGSSGRYDSSYTMVERE